MATCLLFSCAGLSDYGALGPPVGSHGTAFVADLENGWERYDIYYNTWYAATPAALMFDPRDNGITLTGKSWTKVEEQAVFSDYLKRLNPSTRLFAIVGPKKQLLGYMLTPTNQLYIKKIDDKTYYVSNLRPPPSPK